MRELSKGAGIKYQDEIILAGGTDASPMQIAGRGTIVGAISIPMSNIHTSCEMFDMLDVKEAVKLTIALCEKLN
jgi:endoglucanase